MTWRAFAYRLGREVQGDRRFAILRELRASERWPRQRVEEERSARLRALLLHAFEHVPYYRPLLLASGVVTGGRIPTVDLTRLQDLPPLDRGTIRDRMGEIEDRRPPGRGNRRWTRRSGGSTADPVWVVHDRVTHEHSGAVTRWFDGWTGYAPGQPKVVVWEVKPRSLGQRALDQLRCFVKGETVLSIEVLSEAIMDDHLDRIARRRPVQVLGFTGPLYQLARHAQASGRPVPSPRAVMVSAEPLYPDMRETIERVFGAPVFNRYGAVEVGGIACECDHRVGLHVSALTHHVEVVNQAGRPCEPGEIGEILVTPLTNHSMPLIRYRIGDLAALRPAEEACPCGRAFPRLTDLIGRTLDSFVRPDGAWVHGVKVKRFYHGEPWIRQFQVIQTRPDHVHVRLVDHERVPDPLVARRPSLDRITRYLRGLLGEACQVTFAFVDRIPRSPSGKARVTMRLAEGEPPDEALADLVPPVARGGTPP